MDVVFREYRPGDRQAAREIWNQVVEEGNEFPGDEILSPAAWDSFVKAQTKVFCAVRGGEILGVYILHPNQPGHCGHIANASFGVRRDVRGQGIGQRMVKHALAATKACGFAALQFNAVVVTNHAAVHIYDKLGFTRIGTIPRGYRTFDGEFLDLYLYYKAV